ncbi:hypothetical protein [Shewanella violacea]|uniref:Uncharacterized protein n=1 Tax=Shewanella violacea (strain JCM 10179 / CIP 106290 / LMG 19151 / DSS12) TaxID=637905 RepID=D4ZJT9_SHEVD|nr:hypothetical protein [Shewanella violacea]BAJ01938.1 conserved hypothetical protein [Shewanella violacea DSS12]
MNSLFTYIKAIKDQKAKVSIVIKHAKTSRYTDGDIEVSEKETRYHYDNGVVIQCKIERDNSPSEGVCEECWISYEVINSGQQSIRPSRKTFINTCQETFWLKMQSCAQKQ